MINSSTTGRMTTEHWVNFFGIFLSYFLGIMLGKVGGIFKSGCDRQCTFSIGNCFPNDIIIFLNLMPQEVVARHPVHPSVLKSMKPCMVGMFRQPHL